MIKLAYGSVPKDGGTFTFYRNLRPALLKYGIDMKCVAVGKQQARLCEESYIDEGCILLAPNTFDVKRQAREFVRWCKREGINVVMGINSEAILSAIPHLPQEVRVLSRCANAFDHGYKITLSGKERLEGIVAITPRLRDDLINEYGADPQLLHLIPNGINTELFLEASKVIRGTNTKLQLGFLGRLEHNQKGVLHLPEIVKALNRKEIPFELRIAGKGKHQLVLENKLKEEIQSGQVIMLGALNPSEIPSFLKGVDLFLFPSHFEGCPNALLEAMSAGCVPLSWNLYGITDFIIEKNGFLFETGDYDGVAEVISGLNTNRNRIHEISVKANESISQKFTPDIAAIAYSELIKRVVTSKYKRVIPRPWDEFVADPNFEHSWTEYLPIWLYSGVKKMKYRYFSK